jgi:hypothetical protein
MSHPNRISGVGFRVGNSPHGQATTAHLSTWEFLPAWLHARELPTATGRAHAMTLRRSFLPRTSPLLLCINIYLMIDESSGWFILFPCLFTLLTIILATRYQHYGHLIPKHGSISILTLGITTLVPSKRSCILHIAIGSYIHPSLHVWLVCWLE